MGWLSELPGPVYACYEAGPAGFGLYRAAVVAGVRMDVIRVRQDSAWAV